MRAKTVEPKTFQDFYDAAPEEIKDYLDKCKNTPQTASWHPEASNDPVPHNVFAHTKIVFNRAKRTGDINFMLSALFHDIGKFFVTRRHLTIPNKYSAYGHELISLRLVEKYKDWIESIGGNYEIIHYIFKEHMRVKHIHEMQPIKREKFKQDKYFDLVNKFSDFDNMQTLNDEDYKE